MDDERGALSYNCPLVLKQQESGRSMLGGCASWGYAELGGSMGRCPTTSAAAHGAVGQHRLGIGCCLHGEQHFSPAMRELWPWGRCEEMAQCRPIHGVGEGAEVIASTCQGCTPMGFMSCVVSEGCRMPR